MTKSLITGVFERQKHENCRGSIMLVKLRVLRKKIHYSGAPALFQSEMSRYSCLAPGLRYSSYVSTDLTQASYVLIHSAEGKCVQLCSTETSYVSTDSTETGYISDESTEQKCVRLL